MKKSDLIKLIKQSIKETHMLNENLCSYTCASGTNTCQMSCQAPLEDINGCCVSQGDTYLSPTQDTKPGYQGIKRPKLIRKSMSKNHLFKEMKKNFKENILKDIKRKSDLKK
jgi:hypothetical protein